MSIVSSSYFFMYRQLPLCHWCFLTNSTEQRYSAVSAFHISMIIYTLDLVMSGTACFEVTLNPISFVLLSVLIHGPL